MVASPQPQDLPSRVTRLEDIVDVLSRKTLFSAVINGGGLTLNNGGSITVNGGKIVIGPGGSIQLPAGGTITDALGNILFSADALTGQRLSTPFLAVPGVAKWDGNDGAAFRTGGGTGDYVFQAAHCTAETTLWTGVIPQIVHPEVSYSAAIGRVTGSTSTPTYRLYINGSLVDTRTTAVYAGYGSPFRSITSITSFGSTGVSFSLSVQADVTSTDYFACTFSGLAMCGN